MKGKVITKTLVVSDKTKEMMVDYFEDLKRIKTPPYAVFQADDGDTVVTMYQSGKVVFQGRDADLAADFWIETEKINAGKAIVTSSEDKKEKKEIERKIPLRITSIGSDEVGTGDFFGPIVVTAAYVTKADVDFKNTNTSNVTIYSGGKTNATGLQGEVYIDSAKTASLEFNKISGNTTIKLGDKCETLKLYVTHDNASATRYILSGKNVTMYEDDLTDDVAAYKMDSKPEFTNKLNGSGPLLDVVGKKTNIYAYFKIENSAADN